MDTIRAFAMGQANRDREMMVFDWDRAARRIRETGAREASAGLRDDWEYTGGGIFQDGKPDFESYTFLASTWAVPEIDLDGIVEECYRMESEVPGWGAGTKWPDSALALLEGEAAAAAGQ